MLATSTPKRVRTINDPEVLRQINALRQTDNCTNWFCLAREYAFLAIIVGATIVLYERFWEGPWSLIWAIPVTMLAIVCIGAGQHRLATLTHEAAHYMLFKNRILNDLASDWFCMFPLFGNTQRYRVQHLGHHRHPNEPELDPDLTQLAGSGHRFAFPMTLRQFVWHCLLKQLLWLPNLLAYVLVRANFQVDQETSPCHATRRPAIPLLGLVLAYHVVLTTALVFGVLVDEPLFLIVVPSLLFPLGLFALLTAPAAWYPDYTLKSAYSERFRSCLRLVFNTLLFCSLAWLTAVTGRPWWLYFFLLWLVPAGTSFAFFMMLGQVIQHGNADHDRFTNTRVFLVHPLIRMAVFPIGNDYHLPHHLFMNVPHYNLPRLHDLLMQTEPYRRKATIVTGYFVHDAEPPRHPTVVDLVTADDTVPAS